MSSKLICIVHGAGPCNCLHDPVAARKALHQRRDRRRSERRAARERARSTGERYSVALEAVRLHPKDTAEATPVTKLGAALARLKATGAATPTEPTAAKTPIAASRPRSGAADLHRPFRDTWLQMNARMAEPTVRDVERSVSNTMVYARGSFGSPLLTKHELLYQMARLETPLEVARAQRNASLVDRVRDVCESIELRLRILDREIEEAERRYRGVFDRIRWGLPPLEAPKPPPGIEAAARRVQARLVELRGEPAITST